MKRFLGAVLLVLLSVLPVYAQTGGAVVIKAVDSSSGVTTDVGNATDHAIRVTQASGGSVWTFNWTQLLGAAPSATNPMPIRITDGTSFFDPRTIRALTSSDVVTVVQGTGSNLHVYVDAAPTTAVTAASLPLPSGAATSAKQPALGTAGTPSSDVISVQGVVGGQSVYTRASNGNVLATSLDSSTLHFVTMDLDDGTDATTGAAPLVYVLLNCTGCAPTQNFQVCVYYRTGANDCNNTMHIYSADDGTFVSTSGSTIKAFVDAQLANGESRFYVDTFGVKTIQIAIKPAAATLVTNVNMSTQSTSVASPIIPVVRGGAKGSTTIGEVTSTANGSNHQGLDVQLYDGSGNAVSPLTNTQLRATAVPVSGSVSANIASINGSSPVITGGVSGLLAVGGAAASAQSKSGNPVQVGGVFNTTQPTVTTGQVVEGQSTARGASIVATGVDAFVARISDGTNTAPVSPANTSLTFSSQASLVTTNFSDTGINGVTGPQRMTSVGGKTNDGTPQYQLLPLGPSGRSVVMEGNASGVAVPSNITQVGGATLTIGQQLAAASIPVILPSATVTTLTPPAAITNYANETGGNLATLAGAVTSSVLQANLKQFGGSALTIGQQLAAASIPVILPSATIATLTPPTSVTVTQATGTNLHAVLDSGTTTVTQATGTNLHAVLDSTSSTIVTQATAANLNATVTNQTLTKGTQGSTGVSTQDLKDAGRTAISFYANSFASGATTTETIITWTQSKGTGAVTAATASYTITSGKTLRISALQVASRGNATATAQSTVFNLRLNTAGACVVTSTPILFAAQSATAAVASAWDRVTIPIPDGYEIAGNGTISICISAAATFTTNAPTWAVNLIGYEY